MSRVYFNGVSNIEFNGNLLSFVLDDTHSALNGSKNKAVVIELISELETVEGACRYILNEIEKIKKMSTTSKSDPKEDALTSPLLTAQSPKLGLRLSVLNSEHGTD